MSRITNRGILLLLSLLVFVGENQYYGWNAKPMSHMELWWDNLVIILWVLGMFVSKRGVIIVKKEKL